MLPYISQKIVFLMFILRGRPLPQPPERLPLKIVLPKIRVKPCRRNKAWGHLLIVRNFLP